MKYFTLFLFTLLISFSNSTNMKKTNKKLLVEKSLNVMRQKLNEIKTQLKDKDKFNELASTQLLNQVKNENKRKELKKVVDNKINQLHNTFMKTDIFKNGKLKLKESEICDLDENDIEDIKSDFDVDDVCLCNCDTTDCINDSLALCYNTTEGFWDYCNADERDLDNFDPYVNCADYVENEEDDDGDADGDDAGDDGTGSGDSDDDDADDNDSIFGIEGVANFEYEFGETNFDIDTGDFTNDDGDPVTRDNPSVLTGTIAFLDDKYLQLKANYDLFSTNWGQSNADSLSENFCINETLQKNVNTEFDFLKVNVFSDIVIPLDRATDKLFEFPDSPGVSEDGNKEVLVEGVISLTFTFGGLKPCLDEPYISQLSLDNSPARTLVEFYNRLLFPYKGDYQEIYDAVAINALGATRFNDIRSIEKGSIYKNVVAGLSAFIGCELDTECDI